MEGSEAGALERIPRVIKTIENSMRIKKKYWGGDEFHLYNLVKNMALENLRKL